MKRLSIFVIGFGLLCIAWVSGVFALLFLSDELVEEFFNELKQDGQIVDPDKM